MILDFPESRQTFGWDCGARAMQSILAYYGFDVEEKEVMDLAGTNGRLGTNIRGIKKVAKKFDLKYKTGRMTIEMIKKEINKKHPVLIAIQAWADSNKPLDWKKKWHSGHYVVAIGYDSKRMYFSDSEAIVITYLPFEELMERWHDLDINNHISKPLIQWGMVFYGKKPIYHHNDAIYMGNRSFKIKHHIYRIFKYKRIRYN